MSFDPINYGMCKKLVESGNNGGSQRECFDLNLYPGETTEGDTTTVGMATLNLCFAGGGNISVSGDAIKHLIEGLNKSENTSVSLDMGDGNPYELFPTFVQHCTNGKIYTFNLIVPMGDAISTFLIFLICTNAWDTIELEVHVS